MPALLPCPSVKRLEQFALGLLDDQESNEVSGHILRCLSCTDSIAELNPNDGLGDILNQIPITIAELPRGPAVDTAIRRACSLVANSSIQGGTDTGGRDSDTGNSGLDIAAGSDLSQFVSSVLSPPRAAGELGWLGPYRILQQIGSGGMGILFLAEDSQLQRRVAIKAILPHLAKSPAAHARFLREARAIASLRHDNIVTIYQVGENKGTPWIAMELLEGEPLDRLLRREPRRPVNEALQIGRQVAEGLSAAHKIGLIHRDIKPANIWLESPGGRIKVLDFGLARAEGDGSDLTHTGTIIGTPAYMSPEQARGKTLDHRTDLFSLGTVMYHALTGVSPFRRKDTVSTITALIGRNPLPIRQVRPEVPEELSQLVSRLLAKDPQSRPQDAQAVALAFSEIIGRLGNTSVAGQKTSGHLPVVVTHKATSSATRIDLAGLTWQHALVGLVAAGIVISLIIMVFSRGYWTGNATSGVQKGKSEARLDSTSFNAGRLAEIQSDAPPTTINNESSQVSVQPDDSGRSKFDSESVREAAKATIVTSGQKPDEPVEMVSLMTGEPTRMVLGELTRENETHIEVMELKSGKLQIFEKGDLKTVRRSISDRMAIETAGLANFLAWKIKKVLPVAVAGRIAQLDRAVVYITPGSNAGLEVGNQLVVYRDGDEIRDPQTGFVLGTQKRMIANLETIEVQETFAKAKMTGELEVVLQVGDHVQTVVVNDKVAIFPLVNETGVETAVAKRMSEELTTGLVNRGIAVVERRLMDQVVGELSRQQEPVFDSAMAQRVGKQLGAYGVLVGTLSPKDKASEAQLRFVRVESGEILIAAAHEIREAKPVGKAEPVLLKPDSVWNGRSMWATGSSPVRLVVGSVDGIHFTGNYYGFSSDGSVNNHHTVEGTVDGGSMSFRHVRVVKGDGWPLCQATCTIAPDRIEGTWQEINSSKNCGTFFLIREAK